MTDQRPARILVIDDEVTQRILVKEYLEEAGYVVRLSDDGRRGLKMAAATKPDLIILDLMLPSIDGYTLCTCLKQAEATADIPIILITASREPGVIERGLAAGADDFVTKPVDWAFLADRVKFVLGRKGHARAGETEQATGDSAHDSHGDVAKAAMAELQRFKVQAREDLDAAERRHQHALARAQANFETKLAETMAAADEERGLLEQQHAVAIEELRQGAAAELDAARNAAQVNAEHKVSKDQETIAALRNQLDALAKDQGAALKSGFRELQDKHALELRNLEERFGRETAALKTEAERYRAVAVSSQEKVGLLEARLKEARTQFEQQLSAVMAGAHAEIEAARAAAASQIAITSEEHQRVLADAVAAARAEALEKTSKCNSGAEQSTLLAIEAAHDERVRSCWEMTRAASVAQLDALSDIVSLAKAAAKNAGSEADTAEALQEISAKGRALIGATGKLRLLAQVMSGTSDFRESAFDLSKLVSDAVASVRELADTQKVTIAMRLPGQAVALRGDASRLSYAVISVLVNAIRYTPPGGQVDVSLETTEDGGVNLEIADTGVGIAPVQLEALRACLDRPGQIAGGQEAGMGLGIPLATALVRQHGGGVSLMSGLGRGTRVGFTLPSGPQSPAGHGTVPGMRQAI